MHICQQKPTRRPLLKKDTVMYEVIVEWLQKQLKPRKSALVAIY